MRPRRWLSSVDGDEVGRGLGGAALETRRARGLGLRLAGRAPPSHVRVARARHRVLLRLRLLDLAQVRRQVAAGPHLRAAEEGIAFLCKE